MKLENINIDATLNEVVNLLKEDKQVSAALKATITLLVTLIKLLTHQIGLNSNNSSKPPSTDSDTDKSNNKKKKRNSDNKRGGQKGHVGTTLEKIDDPDETQVLMIDRRTLPKGDYKKTGFATRQAFDIDILRMEKLIEGNALSISMPAAW